MDLRTYLKALRKSWWLVLLLTLVGAGLGQLRTYQSDPEYSTAITFFVSTGNDSTVTPLQADQFAQRRINSYVLLLDSEDLATDVINASGTTLSVSQVQGAISGAADVNTVLLRTTVVANSPDESVRLATALVAVFPEFIAAQEPKDENGRSPVELRKVSGPTLNPTPISPQPTLNLGLGTLVGLVLGAGLAILRERLDTSVRSLDTIRRDFGLPVLGTIALDSGAKTSPVLLGDLSRSIRAESYRQIRTNLQFMDVDNPVQVLVVTSSMPSEGKSSTAANLAIVSAEAGRRVLLVEADLRRPKVSEYLGIERAVGLSNVLAGQVYVEDVIQHWGSDGLSILPSGSVPPNPSELLGSNQMVDLIETLRGMFDLIVIDTPPLLPVTDAAVASTIADGAVLVVRYGKTTQNQISASLHSLEAIDARVLGAVVSMMPRKGADSSGYGGYGYYEEEVRRSRWGRRTKTPASFDRPLIPRPGHSRLAPLLRPPAPEVDPTEHYHDRNDQGGDRGVDLIPGLADGPTDQSDVGFDRDDVADAVEFPDAADSTGVTDDDTISRSKR